MSMWQRVSMRRVEFGLLLLGALIMAVTVVNLELSQGNELSSSVLWVIGGYFGVFSIAHLALCFLAPYADQLMLPVAALLNGLGLIMINRLDVARGTSMAPKQVMWALVAIVLMIVVLLVVRDYRTLSRYSFLLGLVGLVLLALPMVWPSGTNADAKLWISIGPFSLQPGEFSKILLLLFFAQLLVNKRALFQVAGARFLGLVFPRFRDLAPILGVWAVALLIMAGENDFGPALLLFSTVLGMLYLATGRSSWLIIGTVLVVIGGFGVYQISDKIQSRVHNFMDPIGHYDTTGYQLSQALFGMSFGGITGTGLGQGYPQQVPVAESDFILAALGEELGLGFGAVCHFCLTRFPHSVAHSRLLRQTGGLWVVVDVGYSGVRGGCGHFGVDADDGPDHTVYVSGRIIADGQLHSAGSYSAHFGYGPAVDDCPSG